MGRMQSGFAWAGDVLLHEFCFSREKVLPLLLVMSNYIIVDDVYIGNPGNYFMYVKGKCTE